MTFIKRHTRAVIFCFIALFLTFLASWFFGNYQIGIGPEFVVKGFAKLFYLGLAFIGTHIVVKYLFPTVYKDTNSDAGEKISKFRQWWDAGDNITLQNETKMSLCIYTHIGAFIGVCLLLALAF